MSEHIVERAIIMAAGIGQRLRPVTLTTPKPLVTVNGVCMIDTIIAALYANAINQPFDQDFARLSLSEYLAQLGG